MARMVLALAALGLAAAGASFADEVPPDEVQFNEYGEVAEPLTDTPGDPVEGRLLVGSKGAGNCIACHAATDLEEFPFHGEIGPVLDGVGDRWPEEALRGIVANAEMVFPETMMPAFYKSSGFIRPGDDFTGKAGEEPLPPLLSAQQVEDVVAYLMTLKEG